MTNMSILEALTTQLQVIQNLRLLDGVGASLRNSWKMSFFAPTPVLHWFYTVLYNFLLSFSKIKVTTHQSAVKLFFDNDSQFQWPLMDLHNLNLNRTWFQSIRPLIPLLIVIIHAGSLSQLHLIAVFQQGC